MTLPSTGLGGSRAPRLRVRLAVAVAALAAGVAGVAPRLRAQAPARPPVTVPAPLPIPPGVLPPPAPPSNTVKITFTTVPVKKAMVFWGKRRLGLIAPHAPLIVQRPRDSGPLDVVITSDGFVPVQTRAYTFADGKISVKLTPLDQKNTLLGYRQEVPPEPDGGAAGGCSEPNGCGQVVPPVGPIPDAGMPR